MATTSGEKRWASGTASWMWSKCPWVTQMVSTRSMWCPLGYAGLPSVQGSIRMTCPDGRRNWNDPCPSQVICIPAIMPRSGAGRRSQHARGLPALDHRVADCRQPAQLLISGLIVALDPPEHNLQLLLLLVRRQRVREEFVTPGLACQFPVTLPALGRDRAVGQGRSYGATAFAGMRTVAIAAVRCQCRNLVEGAVHAAGSRPELQFAHARRIDERATLFQCDQFPMGGGMTAAAVRHAHFLRPQALLAQNAIRDGRFTYAR